ncbi:MAG TPA: phytoene desaturase family protein, partial [Phnomibacter sp.]|nr:phytoene desaturase family protein [Phnomibacter sp.]
GFGGLSAAIRLQARGHDVTILEKRDQWGGRAYQYEINGFKFDGGPTVLTAPHLFDELYAMAGKRREDYFQMVPLDPFYRIFDERGEGFNYWRDRERSVEEVARFSPADVAGYRRFLEGTLDVFQNFYPYTEKAFETFGSFAKILPYVFRTGTWRSMYPYAAQFVKDEFMRKVCSFHPLLVGGNPFDTPTIYGLIIQFEREWGIHYAKGGTGAVVNGLGRLFLDLGGHIHFNTEVKEIVIKDRSARGVRLPDGSLLEADEVVCNGDVPFTYKHLIARQHRPRWVDAWLSSMTYSNSLVVTYFGTNRRYNTGKLAHHNLILPGDHRRQMRQIFGNRSLPPNPSLYLHMPSLTDATIAPEGCESFYVLSLVPHLDAEISWGEAGPAYSSYVLRYLEDHFLPGLQSHIVAQHSIDPLHFRHTLNSEKGAAFSVKPTMMQSGYFRPANKSKVFDHLFFVGAGVHPGAGVPAVMASGKIAAEMIAPLPADRLEPAWMNMMLAGT